MGIYFVSVGCSRIPKNCEVVGLVTRRDVVHYSNWMNFLPLFLHFGMAGPVFIKKVYHLPLLFNIF